MEYVGELLDFEEFVRRTRQYSKEGTRHHYFMALNADEVIDATLKGSISRFINHSCDPNCETQKVMLAMQEIVLFLLAFSWKTHPRLS